MQIGKVPENILKRSVFKQIHHRRPEVLLHPGVGEDCSAVEAGEGEVLVFSVDPILLDAADQFFRLLRSKQKLAAFIIGVRLSHQITFCFQTGSTAGSSTFVDF